MSIPRRQCGYRQRLPCSLPSWLQRFCQFVEMRELLADIMALQRQLDTIHAQPAFPLLAAACTQMRAGVLGWGQAGVSTTEFFSSWLWTASYSGVSPVPAATILSATVGPSSFSTLYQEADRQVAQCALAFFTPPRAQGPGGGIPQLLQVMPPANTTLTAKRAIRPERICVSWNKGRYAFPGGCTFRHVCSSCCGVGALPGPPDGSPTRPSP